MTSAGSTGAALAAGSATTNATGGGDAEGERVDGAMTDARQEFSMHRRAGQIVVYKQATSG